MEVELGFKNITRYETSLTEFVEHVSQTSAVDVSAGGSYMGFGASLEVNFEDFKGSSSFQNKFGSYQTTLTTGTPSLPEPIGLSVEPMYKILSSKYWQNTSLLTQHHACMTSDLALLTAVKTNMARAIGDYAAYKLASLPSDPDLKIPVTWPRGTYGLYMARTGCPHSSFPWHQGWLYQDVEDIGATNVFSKSLHLYGQFTTSDNIETHYCIKGTAQATDFDLDWPKGDYCIAKYGACPKGFMQGWLYWNDEDAYNGNKHGGYLPDGVYDENTRIEYCCRNDSLPTIPISLPTESPFYLLRHSRTCQRVQNMNTVEEFVYWDEQYVLISYDIKSGGYHPFDDGNSYNHKLHFCYYTPMPSNDGSDAIIG
ncbi:MACPF domain-containing protein 4 [Plakobranchus ocellatus]|uniref:MACPF domain-containing protein 4 n=1 Tax=Plakobranchus ocellatus TaxID=259542 RepID=A0AAV3Y117_9GAST|nr:MACPF domain-containing protein 4 [Plakobranchus ocellatus]